MKKDCFNCSVTLWRTSGRVSEYECDKMCKCCQPKKEVNHGKAKQRKKATH